MDSVLVCGRANDALASAQHSVAAHRQSRARVGPVDKYAMRCQGRLHPLGKRSKLRSAGENLDRLSTRGPCRALNSTAHTPTRPSPSPAGRPSRRPHRPRCSPGPVALAGRWEQRARTPRLCQARRRPARVAWCAVERGPTPRSRTAVAWAAESRHGHDVPTVQSTTRSCRAACRFGSAATVQAVSATSFGWQVNQWSSASTVVPGGRTMTLHTRLGRFNASGIAVTRIDDAVVQPCARVWRSVRASVTGAPATTCASQQQSFGGTVAGSRSDQWHHWHTDRTWWRKSGYSCRKTWSHYLIKNRHQPHALRRTTMQ